MPQSKILLLLNSTMSNSTDSIDISTDFVVGSEADAVGLANVMIWAYLIRKDL
jgi:hypothetical protein